MLRLLASLFIYIQIYVHPLTSKLLQSLLYDCLLSVCGGDGDIFTKTVYLDCLLKVVRLHYSAFSLQYFCVGFARQSLQEEQIVQVDLMRNGQG